MDKKKIIQIAVIIVAFGGSGIVLYNGFFKQPPAPSLGITTNLAALNGSAGLSASSTSAGGGQILPYGNKLDFSQLDSGRFQFGAVQYPQVNTSTDIGVPVDSMLGAASPQPPAGK